MLNQNSDTHISETVIVRQAIDPGPPAPPGADMLDGLQLVDVPTGPVRNPDAPPPADDMVAGLHRTAPTPTPAPPVPVAAVAPLAGPMFGPSPEQPTADLNPPLIGPVTATDKRPEPLRGEAFGPLVMAKHNAKEIMASHLNDLVDDLKRLGSGAYNQFKGVMGRQTLGADLMRLYQDQELDLTQCMAMVAITAGPDGDRSTVITLTLPQSKMTGRIQMKLIPQGFKPQKTEAGVVLRSSVPDADSQ